MPILGELDFRGFRYRYKLSDKPRGEWLVILGGALQSLNSWDNYLDYYNRTFRVVVCDLPGMGESDTLPRGYPMEFLADCLKHLLDSLGITRVHIKAVSYGTPITYIFANKYPEHVDRVILAGTMKRIPDAVMDDTLASVRIMQSEDREQAIALFTRMFLCTDRQDDIQNSRLAQKLLRIGISKLSAIRRKNYVENTLRMIHTPHLDYSDCTYLPFLIFTGEYDNYTRPEYCREVAQLLPAAHYTLIKQADHLANLEQYDTVSRLCEDFFTGRDISHEANCGPYERLGVMA
jgi:pimeloyl-ACP methyl ester carboxylesterase